MSQSHAELAWLRGTFVTPVPCVHARCSPGCYPRGFARTGNARGGSLGRVQGHGADRREARAAMRGRERSVLCSFPGCGEILNEPGRCAEHRREGYNWRGSRLAGYDSTRWKRTSVRIRRERPTCERCGVRPSAHVHHRRHLHWPDPGFFDPDELEALCAPCHRTVTGRHAAMVKQGRANTGRASVSSPRLQADRPTAPRQPPAANLSG
jgi:5-methylcytosine-specific restriction enzyme A